RRRHTRCYRDWSSDVCSSDLARFAACFVTGEYFPGRCEAFRLARKATADGFGGDLLLKSFRSCRAGDRELHDLRSGAARVLAFRSEERRVGNEGRLWMRTYAS